MKLQFRYLVEEPDRHGNVRLYVRRHGKRVRIREQPGTPEFMAAYNAAMSGKACEPPKAIPPASLRWLVAKYLASAEFRRLNESTRKARRGILESICQEHGAKPFARMEARHVKAVRDEKEDLPEAGNGRVKALRQLFAWAIDAEIADRNPARDCPYIKTGSDGFHTWTVSEVRQFEGKWPVGTKQRLAMALLAFTGVRRSDAVLLGPQMEYTDQEGDWLRFTEIKGRGRHAKHRDIPLLPELRAVIAKTKSGHLAYLVTAFGKPFSAAGFGNWFREACDAAKLPQCSAHGLRKAGATIAAENGASEKELEAIFGWETMRQAAHYTKRANRRKLAARAMKLIVPRDQEGNGLVSPLKSSETKRQKRRMKSKAG